MRALPSGTVTFLFTDLEGSTPLSDQHPEAMKDALARHSKDNHDIDIESTGHDCTHSRTLA
jgi:hypothetical protein